MRRTRGKTISGARSTAGAIGLVCALLVPQAALTAGAPMVEVTVPALTELQQQGKDAFDQYCASCHGADAAGQLGKAPPLIHPVYEPSHHGDLSFIRAVRFGARQHHWPFGNMEPVEGVTDDEIAVIIAYVRAVQRANGID